jgi:integrase
MAHGFKTQADVDRISPPTDCNEIALFDQGSRGERAVGLAVRARRDGNKTFAYFFRFGGKSAKLTIGPVTGFTLKQARARAIEAAQKVRSGIDPRTEIRAAHESAADAMTFGAVVALFLDKRKKTLKARTHAEVARHLDKHWGAFKTKAIHTITRDDIAHELRLIETRRGATARNRARTSLNTLFSWAIGEGLTRQLQANPVAGTNKADEAGARDRVLTDAELVAILNACSDTPYGRIVRLLALTGQRRDEIGGLRWSEVIDLDGDQPRIVFGAERVKNGRTHDVALSPLAVAVLKSQPRHGDRDHVFGENGFSTWSRHKTELDAACGVSEWRVHDLRRTLATRMADLGVQPHVIEATLNHISGHKAGVAGVYNRSTYVAERREALLTWGHRVAVLTAGEKVVTLRRGA